MDEIDHGLKKKERKQRNDAKGYILSHLIFMIYGLLMVFSLWKFRNRCLLAHSIQFCALPGIVVY